MSFAISYRAQLGRLGGSRWGWVLQIKCHAIKPGNPGTDLEEKAAAKILKYRELYRDRRRQIDGRLTSKR